MAAHGGVKNDSAKSEEQLRFKAAALVSRYAPTGIERIDKAGIDALGERAVLVDCRTHAEREVSIIPGALSREQFERDGGAEVALAQGRTVIPYCTVGLRSGNYALELKRRHEGLKVSNGEGIVQWSVEGGELVRPPGGERGGERTDRLHVFGPAFSVVREGIEPVTFGGGGAAGLLHMAREAIGRLAGVRSRPRPTGAGGEPRMAAPRG
jgi:rhodanese-related sulfurtransferase